MSIGKLQNRGGNFVARLGGADVLKQEELSKLTPEQMVQYNQQREAARNVGMRELSARLSDAFAGRDVAGRAAARRPMIEAQKKQEEQNKLLDEAIKQSTSITDERKKYLYALPYETKASAFLKFAQPNEKKLTAAIQDYEYFSKLPEEQRLDFMQATGRGSYSPELLEQKRIAQSPGGLDLTVGEKKLDEAFANTLVKWKGGEKQQAESNIRNLENKIALLGKGANVSGPEYAFIPEGLMPVVAPGATGFKDEISDIVFQSLRATLGAQFTQKEGERLISATFNQNLPEEFNVPRLQRLLAKTKSIYNDKQSQIDYYNESGTLKGYVGEPATFDDILDAVFFDELKQLSNEDIIKRYKDAPTTEERLSILRFAQSLEQQSK